MFQDDCCLQCGKPVIEEGRIYCSAECQSLDSSSSTASSAFSSPVLSPYAIPTDLPALDLKQQTETYLMWDNDEDDEDDAAEPPALRLSYARRPSSTNNHSTIPLLHCRSSSRAAPSASPTQPPPTQPPAHPSPHLHAKHKHSSSASEDSDARAPSPLNLPARKRNRASLPAYFSLLTPTSPRTLTSSMIPTSASVTMSPPFGQLATPRLARPALDSTHAVAGGSPSSAPLFTRHHSSSLSYYTSNVSEKTLVEDDAPRGRRREHNTSRRRSPSRSRSRSRPIVVADGEVRGRRRAHELDGWAVERGHGYGNGRSGLRERGRDGAWVAVGGGLAR